MNWLFFLNERGFGGGGDTPSVPSAPAISPSPVPTETQAVSTLQGRQRQIAMLKYGSLSTIANQGGASGITGSGPDIYPSMGGGKQTTGQ